MNGKKKFMKNAITAMAVFACVGFTGCMDEVYNGGESDKTEEPSTFDFSTKKTVEFTLNYDVSGYRVYFEVYTKCPLTLDVYKSYVKDYALTPFFSGRCNENGTITFKGDLPATVKEIFAYSPAIGVPVLMKATISDAGVVSKFEPIEVKAASSTRAGDSPSGTNGWRTNTVTLDQSMNLPSVSTTITEKDKELIDKSFSPKQDYSLVTTYYRSSIQFTGEAKVKIYSVSNGGESNRTNALAYSVNSQSDDALKQADVNNNLKLVFPKLNKTTPAQGAGYQLLNGESETFSAGSSIGFVLFPDIENGIKTNDANILYSYFGKGDNWNSYSFPSMDASNNGLQRARAPHMVLSLLRVTETGSAIVAIGFEDQPWAGTHGTNRGDFRDDIFIVEVSPATSLPDDLPEPPTDEPSYDSEYETSGILCFEDCWPAKGDYDMNDIVVSYKRSIRLKDKVGAVSMKEVYTFLNNGASYKNGFAYQLMYLNKNAITSCKVESTYKFEGQGLDATMTEPVVVLFDDGKAIGKETTFTVTTVYNDPYYYGAVNPFIVVRDGQFASSGDMLSQGRVEVHLPTLAKATLLEKFLPTGKANTSYWGAEDDLSDPVKNIYYVRKGNYPFALNIQWDPNDGDVNNFVIPTEKQGIEQTYPGFTKWVESNKTTDNDWYLHPNKK